MAQHTKKVAAPKISGKAKECIECHEKKKISNIALRDWQYSKHAERGVTCVECHIPDVDASSSIKGGSTICDNKDVRRAVSPKNCEVCHEDQVKQFAAGKHAGAWKTLQNLEAAQGGSAAFKVENDCAGCHRIGSDEGKCDSCHTRHRFSAAEARRPEACRTCHMGGDHPQWETYSSSKHGSIYSIEGDDWFWENSISEWYKEPLLESPVVPRAPVCVTCHMSEGNHAVNTAWSFLGMRLSDDDPDWKKHREIYFNGLGFFNEEGFVADELKAIISGHEGELSSEFWQAERDKMIKVCSQCHTAGYSRDVFKKADAAVKACDELIVKAIVIVEGLYKDGVIKKSAKFFPHKDILKFNKFENPIEERLYKMFADRRMKTYLGSFHINPAYQHGYGWAEIKQDLSAIEAMADSLRKEGSEK